MIFSRTAFFQHASFLKTHIQFTLLCLCFAISACHSSNDVDDDKASPLTTTQTFTDSTTLTDTETLTDTNTSTQTQLITPVTSFQSSGLSIALNASESTSESDAVLTFNWQLSDGTSLQGPIVSHTFAQAQEHSATLTIVDPSDNTSSTTLVSFNLTDNGSTTDETILEGELLYIEAQCGLCHGADSQDENLAITLEDVTHASLSSVIETTMPIDPGKPEHCQKQCADAIATWLLSLYVPEVMFEPAVVVPVVSFEDNGLSVVVNASESEISENANITYSWIFSDGTVINEPIAAHTYAKNGAYNADLIITDLVNGATYTAARYYNLVGSVYSAEKNTEVEGQLLYKEAKCDQCHGPDGQDESAPIILEHYTHQSLSEPIKNDMPQQLASADMCLQRCADSIAAWLLSTYIPPETVNPVSSFNSNELSVVVDATGSTAPNDEALSYSWAFSDGTIIDEPIAAHSFSQAGDHSATLTLTHQLTGETFTHEQPFTLAGTALADEHNQLLRGELLYTQVKCNLCHGEHGEVENQPIELANFDQTSLSLRIETSMPHTFGKIEDCQKQCSDDIATWLMSFYETINCTEGVTEILPQRLRKLNNAEYEQTVQDLLNRQDINSHMNYFPADSLVNGYKNNASASAISVSPLTAYWDAAKTISESTNVIALLNCSSDELTSCAEEFIPDFGLKAFRRPLTTQEIDKYSDLFVQGENIEQGAMYALQAFLSSPSFLYRSEIGQSGQLTAFETASMLSYTFWGSLPDDVLFQKAADNLLITPAQLEQEAQRLLNSPKAKTQLARFAQQWLNIDSIERYKNAQGYADVYSAELGASMDTEFELFVGDALTSSDLSVDYLFNADTTYVNEILANFYGFSDIPETGFAQVNVNEQRGGILNMGALLAHYGKSNSSNPITRGVMVRERLLCHEFGRPPVNVGEVVEVSPELSTRDRFAAHSTNATCAFCHVKIDDIGFAFERYDGIGQYRTTEGDNIAVSDDGILVGIEFISDTDIHTFNGTHGLSQLLTTDALATVEHCLIEQFQNYMHGVEHFDSCAAPDVHDRWNTADGIVDLWIKSVGTHHFLNRQ